MLSIALLPKQLQVEKEADLREQYNSIYVSDSIHSTLKLNLIIPAWSYFLCCTELKTAKNRIVLNHK